jgi:hypothetical protein
VKTSKPAIAISLLIIGLGVGWLLNTMRVFGGEIDWIWVSALGISGILLLALAKLDRFNFVVGTSLIICSILSLLRYTGKLSINLEAPILFISVGLLLLLSHIFRLPGASETSPETLSPPPVSTTPESSPTDPKI